MVVMSIACFMLGTLTQSKRHTSSTFDATANAVWLLPVRQIWSKYKFFVTWSPIPILQALHLPVPSMLASSPGINVATLPCQQTSFIPYQFDDFCLYFLCLYLSHSQSWSYKIFPAPQQNIAVLAFSNAIRRILHWRKRPINNLNLLIASLKTTSTLSASLLAAFCTWYTTWKSLRPSMHLDKMLPLILSFFFAGRLAIWGRPMGVVGTVVVCAHVVSIFVLWKVQYRPDFCGKTPFLFSRYSRVPSWSDPGTAFSWIEAHASSSLRSASCATPTVNFQTILKNDTRLTLWTSSYFSFSWACLLYSTILLLLRLILGEANDISSIIVNFLHPGAILCPFSGLSIKNTQSRNVQSARCFAHRCNTGNWQYLRRCAQSLDAIVTVFQMLLRFFLGREQDTISSSSFLFPVSSSSSIHFCRRDYRSW